MNMRNFHQKFFKGKNIGSVVIIGGLILLLLFLSSNLISNGLVQDEVTIEELTPPPQQVTNHVSAASAHARQLEERLSQAFTHVEGVGETMVMVTLSSSISQVVAQDSILNESSTVEATENGATREIISRTHNLTYVTTGGGPLILTTYYPRVEGVIIVAQGGRDPHVVEALIHATRAVLGIEANRISILPMSS